MSQEVWHRFEDRLFIVDKQREHGVVDIVHCTYPVIRHTKCGAWLDVYGKEKWASKTSKRKFACPTKEQAKKSFIARKKAQIRILRRKLKTAEEALEMMSSGDMPYESPVIRSGVFI